METSPTTELGFEVKNLHSCGGTSQPLINHREARWLLVVNEVSS
jgi:hypothetical protein